MTQNTSKGRRDQNSDSLRRIEIQMNCSVRAEDVISGANVLENQTNCIKQAVDAKEGKRLWVDFDCTERISSEAINHLIRFHQRAQKCGVAVVLRNVGQNVRHVFQMTRVDRVFEMDESCVPPALGRHARKRV